MRCLQAEQYKDTEQEKKEINALNPQLDLSLGVTKAP